MTPKQLDALFEQVQKVITERDLARKHAVTLQDEIESLNAQIIALIAKLESNDTTTQFTS